MDYVPLGKTGEIESFAVGHFAFGYITSKTSAKLLTTNINIPTILTLAVIPDIDIVFQHFQLLEHRGPTHSVIMAFIIFLPIFAIYRKKAIPYFVALAQHSLVGDYIVGSQTQVLWPLTSGYYGTGISIQSPTNMTLEWIMFLASMIIMLMSRDIFRFFQLHNSNLILVIPTATVLLPTFASIPLEVPNWLILPHLVYLSIFAIAVLIDLLDKFKRALR